MHSFWEDTNPWCLALPPASHSSEVPDIHSSGAEWSSSGSSPLTHQLRPGLSSGSHVLEHSPPVRKDNYKSKLCTCVCEYACTLSHLKTGSDLPPVLAIHSLSIVFVPPSPANPPDHLTTLSLLSTLKAVPVCAALWLPDHWMSFSVAWDPESCCRVVQLS